MSADLWAGAEVQLATLLSYLAGRRDVIASAVLFNDGRLAEELRALGVDVAVVDERCHSAPAIVRSITRFAKERHIDVVHTHRYKDTILGIAAAKLAGVPFVVRTVHGHSESAAGWRGAKARLYEALDKTVLRRCADRVIAVSTNLASVLTNAGYGPRVIAIRNGVDLSRIATGRSREDVRRDLGIEPAALVVGTAGRLSPVKAHGVMLRAALVVLDERPDARFIIAGDGPLRNELMRVAVDLGIDRECIFPGARTDIHDVLGALDVFVLPSLHEGMPMALLEAMALGRPVVATAVGGIPEIVTDGSNGLLVPPGDEQALAAACLGLAREPEVASTLGTRARRTVQREFSHEVNGMAVLDTYRAVSSKPLADRARPSTLTICRELLWGLPVHAWRKAQEAVDLALERRRMGRIRRDPGPLLAAMRSAARVLILCHGNIIRSPFAAALVAQGVGNTGRVSVTSAGLAAVPGRPPHPTALQLANTLDVDLSAHAASPVAADAVAASDAIFVMDVPQLVEIQRRFPEARAKTFLLTCLAPDTPLEICDPYAGGESEFHTCFRHISQAARPIVHALAASSVSV